MKSTLYLSIFIPLLLLSEDIKSKTLLERLAQPKLIINSSYLGEANVKGSEGNVEVYKNRININNAFVGFSYTNWAFEWDNIEDLPFGDGKSQPIKQMHGFNLNTRLPFPINDKWFSLSSLSVKSTFEESPKDSLSFGFFSFASYKASKEHTFQMGAFGNFHSVSKLILPVISYSYRARMRDGVQVILGFPRTYVSYYATPSTLLRLGGIYSQSVIRLSDESSIAAAGFIEAKDYMGNIGATYYLDKQMEIRADLLYALKRDFITYDQGGSELSNYSIEPSLGLALKLVWWL